MGRLVALFLWEGAWKTWVCAVGDVCVAQLGLQK